MADRELDIEFFIEEIKKYPEIWNVSDENYHDRRKKRAAWTNICCLFSDNFEQKDDKERNEICKYNSYLLLSKCIDNIILVLTSIVK